MKRIIKCLLAAAMLCANSVYAANFADVQGHWAESMINELTDKGIVDGYTDAEFAPDGTVTRAEYLKMIMNATGVQPTEFRDGECLEARSSDWYAPYLQKALDIGLIPQSMIAGYKASVEYNVDENGKAESSKVVYSGAFNGSLPINREEMAVLTQYFYQYSKTILTYKENTEEIKIKFTDEENISDWAKISVNNAVAEGFIDGMDDNTFEPGEYATRAQASAIIYRVLAKRA